MSFYDGTIELEREVAALNAALAAERADLEEYRLRLAGALIASEGGNGRPDDAIEAIRTCPTIKSVMDLRADRDALADRVRGLEGALSEIAKGEGRYSRDPLTHASNTIEDMKALAVAALTPPAPQQEKHRG